MPDLRSSDPLVVAVDQGTSSSKAIVVDASGRVLATASVPLSQHHPEPGWVEQDARELMATVVGAIEQAVDEVGDAAARIVALGVSSQRESAIAWDKQTGEPLGPVLGWQDRRTSPATQALNEAGHGARVRDVTGLPIDPMFSAPKFAWLLDQVDPARTRAAAGEIALGTVDAWITYTLTGEHRIEAGNASRTLLMDLDAGAWDADLCELFAVPLAALPRIAASNATTGAVEGIDGLPRGVAITGVLADSHAALYGHGVRSAGVVKTTYGTGSSIMGLLASGARAGDGLVRTLAWDVDGSVQAFEGNILSSGSTAVWLADLLGTTPDDLARLAEEAGDAGGVILVPAFSGLGAPYWDDDAEALLTGLTLGTTRGHLAYAAFESITHQVEDVLAAADAALAAGERIETIRADGGPSANEWLMRMQADVSGRTIETSRESSLSALGAATLAGETAGVWTAAEAAALAATGFTAQPSSARTADIRDRRDRWAAAVNRARGADPADTPSGRTHLRKVS